METVLRSASKELTIGPEQPFCIVGERINPTGRKIFQDQLRNNDLSRIEIDVADPWLLPQYTFFSLVRGLIAYAISLAFTLVYGYWAAKDAIAERVLVPLLDILQSIPVLSFLPITAV